MHACMHGMSTPTLNRIVLPFQTEQAAHGALRRRSAMLRSCSGKVMDRRPFGNRRKAWEPRFDNADGDECESSFIKRERA